MSSTAGGSMVRGQKLFLCLSVCLCVCVCVWGGGGGGEGGVWGESDDLVKLSVQATCTVYWVGEGAPVALPTC